MDRPRYIVAAASFALAWAMAGCGQQIAHKESAVVDPARQQRLIELVEANVRGAHAQQVLMAAKAPSPLAAYAGDAGQMQKLVAHHKSLLASEPAAVKAFVDGRPTAFDRSKDLDPLLSAPMELSAALPVNVVTEYFAARSKSARADIRSVASLYQVLLEVNRDGDLWQDLQRFYINLGLAVYCGQLGLSGDDDDMLAAAREMAAKTCPSPFAVNTAAYRITAVKARSWGEKNLHIRDAEVVAGELLQEKDVAALVGRIKAMPAQRIAVIGHSFTMTVNWSTPSSFTEMAFKVIARHNTAVQYKYFQMGGMTASAAKKKFLADALAYKPDKVFIFTLTSSPADYQALLDMNEAFAKAGASMYVFPHNGPTGYRNVDEVRKFARDNGLKLADFDDVVSSSPDKAKHVSLDGVHMTEPYHRIMAKEFVKLLVDAPK